MYKTHLTATVFKDFSSCYRHLDPTSKNSPEKPFVYVDASGVKLITDVAEYSEEEGIFAVAMAQDGFVEMLSIEQAG